MRTRWTALALVVALSGSLAALAQDTPEPADLTALLTKIHADAGVPALGGAIVTTKGLVAIGAVGKRVQGENEDVTKDDLWHLGSCTKAMTATLLAKLDEEDKLPLDTTLAKAFPKSARKQHETWRDVPISLLLQHRAGAPSDLSFDGLWMRLVGWKGTARDSRALLTAEVLAREPESTPGTEYLYSNAGFAIAGHAAEKRMDAPWENLLRREVFAPLEMSSAGFGAPGDAKKRDQPFGHRAVPTGAFPVPPGPFGDNPAAIGPAGTVHASLADWAKFVRLHLRGARQEEGLLLRPETFKTLHTPADDQQYAMGWIVGRRSWAKGEGDGGVGRVLTHSGSNTMWYCVTWIAPERGFAVLATCNMGGDTASKACDDVSAALIRRHLDD